MGLISRVSSRTYRSVVMSQPILILLFILKYASVVQSEFGYSQEQLDMYDLYDELKPVNFYQFIEVEQEATKRQIKSAYRKRAVQWHPDKVDLATLEEGQDKKWVEDRFRHLPEVNAILINEELRADYDNVLKNGLPPGMAFRYYRYIFKL